MAILSFDTYGKTRVRLLQVLRGGAAHQVVDLGVTILFEGKLADSYITGDNSDVLPTDTIKNTVYALARQHPIESIEEFASRLGKHFLDRLPHVITVKLFVDQTPWCHIGAHQSAFIQSSKEQRTAELKISRDNQSVQCGVRNLQILKTGQSAFFGYLKDAYTTLPESRDRLLNTVVNAEWTLSAALRTVEFNQLHLNVRSVLLDCFAKHESLSVQHTLYAMAETVLAGFDAVQEVHLTMPNKHCLLVDLSRLGLDNPNQIFVPTDEPSGYIEARVAR